MKKAKLLAIACAMGLNSPIHGQNQETPLTATDLLQPIVGTTPAQDTWGGDNVANRYSDNGIESANMSYWGGNVIKGEDGLYHMFVCGWEEKFGRNGYKNKSNIIHATSKQASGPYKEKEILGRGFDPEVYRMSNGTYVVKVWDGQYTSQSLEGPWSYEQLSFDTRDRLLLRGAPQISLSNMTYTERPDHSYMALDRGGAVWVSKDGLREWKMITDKSVYVKEPRTKEDPVIWHDNVQYYMIERNYLDCTGNIYRSLDGVHWTHDEFFYYNTGLIRHADGTKEDWEDLSRWKVITDEQGRVEYISVAVCDIAFSNDKPRDNHSTKNIIIPVVKPRMIEVASPNVIPSDCSSVEILIKGESDFRPAKDLDIKSLRLGSYHNTSRGQGLKATKSKKQGKNDLVVTFTGNGGDMGIDDTEWALRLVGKTKSGKIVHGFASRPNFGKSMSNNYILTAMMPQVDANDVPSSIEVENFGVATSTTTTVRVSTTDNTILSTGIVEPLPPYTKRTIDLKGEKHIPTGTKEIKVTFLEGNTIVNQTTIATRNINAFQERLVALVDSAQNLCENDKYTEGKMEMQMAMMDGLSNISRFDTQDLISSCEQMEESISAYLKANNVSIEFYDFYSWARNEASIINMSTQTVNVQDGEQNIAIALIDNMSDGTNTFDFKGRIAIHNGGHNFNLRNNGENNNNTGLFDYSQPSYMSIRDLTPGMRLTFKVMGDLTVVSGQKLYLANDPDQKEIKAGSNILSNKTYVVKGEEGEKVNVDLLGQHYTSIQNIKIETIKAETKKETTKPKRKATQKK